MNWSYEYPSKEAIHLPTKLEFSVTYDPVTPERKVKLTSKRPAQVTDMQMAGLIQELQVVIQDRYLQRKMSLLLHSDCDGDYDRAARILEQQTKKKVSTRTLQAWMIPPGRPSSRRCPEWAVAALEEYLHRNPDEPRAWKDISKVSRSTPEGRALEHEKQLRERETLRFAEHQIEYEAAIRTKWQACAVADVPRQLAEIELAMHKRSEDHSALISLILTSIGTSDTLQDLKQEIETAIRRKYQLDRLVEDAARDIRERKKEFAADDGTLSHEPN